MRLYAFFVVLHLAFVALFHARGIQAIFPGCNQLLYLPMSSVPVNFEELIFLRASDPAPDAAEAPAATDQ